MSTVINLKIPYKQVTKLRQTETKRDWHLIPEYLGDADKR